MIEPKVFCQSVLSRIDIQTLCILAKVPGSTEKPQITWFSGRHIVCQDLIFSNRMTLAFYQKLSRYFLSMATFQESSQNTPHNLPWIQQVSTSFSADVMIYLMYVIVNTHCWNRSGCNNKIQGEGRMQHSGKILMSWKSLLLCLTRTRQLI